MLSLVVLVTLATRSWAACSMSGWYSSASAAVASPQTSATGTITDGSGNYPNNQECYQAIVPTGAATVSLSFSAFSTESSYDKLYIYDGTSTSSTALMNGVSGSALPAAVQSSGTTMLLKFVSTEPYTQTQTRSGIYAFYVTDGTVSFSPLCISRSISRLELTLQPPHANTCCANCCAIRRHLVPLNSQIVLRKQLLLRPPNVNSVENILVSGGTRILSAKTT